MALRTSDHDCDLLRGFHATEISEANFLTIPVELRERIYILAGLVRDCPISIETERRRWGNMRKARMDWYGDDFFFHGWATRDELTLDQVFWYKAGHSGPFCAFDTKAELMCHQRPGMGCIHPSIPIQLLCISKQIREETVRLLWSRNTIVLGPTLPLMPWLRLELLTILEIQLTTCSCVTDHECEDLVVNRDFVKCPICHFGCKRGKGKPLSLGRCDDRVVIHRWRSFCADLRERCTVALELTFICDCLDMATALKVIRPFHGFPILRHASIRLGQSVNDSLNILALQVVQRLTGKDHISPFSFTKLPYEIQHLVLKQTDLVAPSYLSWHEPLEYYRPFRGNGVAHRYTYAGFWLFDNKQFICCLQCTRSRNICACYSRHAAYSSRVCQCWQFPTALFFVNRFFNQQSAGIFFSKNRFILWEAAEHPDNEYDIPPIPERLESPLKFLCQIPRSYSMHLRWIRFTGRDFWYNECFPDNYCYESWVTLTTMIKQLPSLPRLTVDLNLAGEYRENECGWGLRIRDHDLETAYEGLWELVMLFKPTGTERYQDFYIRIAHSVTSMEEDWHRWHLERQMERHIMGNDYDATLRGKYHEKGQMSGQGFFPESGYFNESLQPKWYLQSSEDLRLDDKRLVDP